MPAVNKETLSAKNRKLLERLYYDAQSTGSYGSVKALSTASKLHQNQVRKWLQSQFTYTLHRRALKKFPRRRYMTRGMDMQHQADLVEMQPYAGENNGYRYMLTLIDLFSRYAWAEPLKSKSADDTAKLLKKIYSTSKRIPKYLQTDAGKEFENKPVREYLNSIGVEQFSIASPLKAAVVERFNRTLKDRMWRMFTKQGSYKWLDILPKLVHSYNNSPHRSLKNMAPSEVTKENETDVWLQMYGGKKKKKVKKPAFKVGDRVKVSKAKQIFDKGYLPNWTEEEFFINSINTKFSPTMYELRDHKKEIIRGLFYKQELQLVINKDNSYRIEKVIRTRGQGNDREALVKWKGYKDPEWIPHKNILDGTK